jgi:hypothetical protein
MVDMSSKPIELNGDGSMQAESREIRSRGQIEAVERASQRVGSWPQWKRSAISYRTASANVNSTKSGNDTSHSSKAADTK